MLLQMWKGFTLPRAYTYTRIYALLCVRGGFCCEMLCNKLSAFGFLIIQAEGNFKFQPLNINASTTAFLYVCVCVRMCVCVGNMALIVSAAAAAAAAPRMKSEIKLMKAISFIT